MTYEDNSHQTSCKIYFAPAVEIKDYNVMIDGQKFFDQSVKTHLRTYNNIQKNVTG